MARTVITPGDQWRQMEETRAAWIALRNQAYGRAVEPRAVPEAVKPLQQRILSEHDRFLAWWDRITWADLILPAVVSEIAEWRDGYNALALEWARSMKGATVVQLPAVQGPGQAAAAAAAAAGGALVAPGGGLFWLAVIGGGIWLLTRPSKEPARGGA